MGFIILSFVCQTNIKSGAVKYLQWAVEVGCKSMETRNRLHNLCSGAVILSLQTAHKSPVSQGHCSLGFFFFFQGRAGYVNQGSNAAQDHAQLPLFSNISDSKLRNTTTFSRKRQLNTSLNTSLSKKINRAFFACRIHQTAGQLWEVFRCGWSRDCRGAWGD